MAEDDEKIPVMFATQRIRDFLVMIKMSWVMGSQNKAEIDALLSSLALTRPLNAQEILNLCYKNEDMEVVTNDYGRQVIVTDLLIVLDEDEQ